MKLIEKKCPNCGAGLKFDKDDTEVVCEYCKKSYVIQRDNTEKKDSTDLSDIDYELIEEVFDKFNKVTNEMFRVPRVTSKVITAIVIIVFVSIFFGALALIGTIASGDIKDKNLINNDPIVEPKKDNYVTELSQIDEKSLEIFHKETQKTLDRWRGYLWTDVKESEWTYVGMYLLVNKNEDEFSVDDNNYLYDVYKKKYTGDLEMEVYGAVMYSDLKLLEDNTVDNSFRGTGYAPTLYVDGRYSSFVYGYEDNEELYNKIIRTKRSDYKIMATDGMYIEN